MAGDLVELVEYPGKGVGVRTLSRFRTCDLLDEYLGQLATDRTQDEDWSVEIAGTSIDSHHLGNWPRFINHSCDYAAEFEFLRAGKTISAVVEVKMVFLSSRRSPWTMERLTGKGRSVFVGVQIASRSTARLP